MTTNTDGSPLSEFLTIDEAAAYASLRPSTVRLFIARGELPAGRIGTRWRIRRSDIDAAIAPINVPGGAT